MDAIVQQIVTLLQPYLPALVMEGAKAIGSEGGKRIISTIWEKLKGKPKVVEAAQELAGDPTDEEYQEIFALRIKKALKDDPQLLAELTKLLSQTGGNVAQANGPGSIAIGGNASGNTIVAGNNNIVGNNNTVQQGKYNIHVDNLTGTAIGDGSTVINRWRDDD